MNLRAFALTLTLTFTLLLLFVTLNWTAFAAPTSLSLGITEVSAPLGVVMLVFTAVVSALFVVYIVLQQATVILETRRFAKEGRTQRELAEKAEASRFTELRTLLDASTREFGERLAQTEHSLQDKLAEATRTTAAYLGEIEDKLDRVIAR